MKRYLGEKCKKHPILDADGRCAACWGYFCDACLEDVGDHRYCEECAPAAHEKFMAAKKAMTEERAKLDMRLLLYTLIGVLAVVIGGTVIYFSGGFDRFLGTYIPSYQVKNTRKSLGSKLDDFQSAKTDHFNIYFHNAETADTVNRLAEDYFKRILTDMLIFEKDVTARGKFNIVIAKNFEELKTLYPDVLANRSAMTDYETKTIVLMETVDAGSIQTNLAHEMAHAIFFERMGSGNRIPDWIHEGISSHEEAKIDPAQTDARWATYGPDIIGGGGLPLSNLVLEPDAGPEEVNLFYAESQSLVAYIVNNYGMLKFMKFSTSLQGGQDINAALNDVYKPDLTDMNGLESKWRDSLN